jgi:hypothetical protein
VEGIYSSGLGHEVINQEVMKTRPKFLIPQGYLPPPSSQTIVEAERCKTPFIGDISQS